MPARAGTALYGRCAGFAWGVRGVAGGKKKQRPKGTLCPLTSDDTDPNLPGFQHSRLSQPIS